MANGQMPSGSWTKAGDSYTWGGTQWGRPIAPMGNDMTLLQWMRDIEQWGTAVAKKCKDLEDRIAALEPKG